MRRDYTATDIRRFLNNYYVLAGYRMPVKPLVEDSHYTEYYGPKIGGPVKASAYFETPALTKADLDGAIQRLTRMEQVVILGVDINAFQYQNKSSAEADVGYWLKKTFDEVHKIEHWAILRMKRLLNGGR